MQKRTLSSFVREFEEITKLSPRLDSHYTDQASQLVEHINGRHLRPLAERKQDFFGRLNWKFRLNAGPLAIFYAAAAKGQLTDD